MKYSKMQRQAACIICGKPIGKFCRVTCGADWCKTEYTRMYHITRYHKHNPSARLFRGTQLLPPTEQV